MLLVPFTMQLWDTWDEEEQRNFLIAFFIQLWDSRSAAEKQAERARVAEERAAERARIAEERVAERERVLGEADRSVSAPSNLLDQLNASMAPTLSGVFGGLARCSAPPVVPARRATTQMPRDGQVYQRHEDPTSSDARLQRLPAAAAASAARRVSHGGAPAPRHREHADVVCKENESHA